MGPENKRWLHLQRWFGFYNTYAFVTASVIACDIFDTNQSPAQGAKPYGYSAAEGQR